MTSDVLGLVAADALTILAILMILVLPSPASKHWRFLIILLTSVCPILAGIKMPCCWMNLGSITAISDFI